MQFTSCIAVFFAYEYLSTIFVQLHVWCFARKYESFYTEELILMCASRQLVDIEVKVLIVGEAVLILH